MTKIKLIQSKYEKIVPVYNKVTRGGNKTAKIYIPGKGEIAYHQELVGLLQPVVADLLDEIGLEQFALARKFYDLGRFTEPSETEVCNEIPLTNLWTIDYKDVERVLVAGLISKELEFVETPVKDDLKYAYVKRAIR